MEHKLPEGARQVSMQTSSAVSFLVQIDTVMMQQEFEGNLIVQYS